MDVIHDLSNLLDCDDIALPEDAQALTDVLRKCEDGKAVEANKPQQH